MHGAERCTARRLGLRRGSLRRFHGFYGPPRRSVEAHRQEKVLPAATDLITQFNPAIPDHDAAIRAFELIATAVAPAVGWKPTLKPGSTFVPGADSAGV